MKTPFSILYLEDDDNDALKFAEVIHELLLEQGEKPSAIIDEETTSEYLEERGIDWVSRFDQFQYCIQQEKIQEYKLFLIDMKMEGEGGVRGWELIETIREKRGNQASPIWILSSYSFFAQPAKKEYRIQHFFHKSTDGYEQIKEALTEYFLPIRPRAQEDYLTFKDRQDRTVQIPVSQIVSIEIINRYHYLYQLDTKGIAAHKRAFFPHKIFAIAQKQIREKGIQDLVQISHGVIINVKLVERIQGNGKRYFVWLSQRGDNKPLSISYPYLKKIKEIYGDPLPLSQ